VINREPRSILDDGKLAPTSFDFFGEAIVAMVNALFTIF
jgi:hypothetical protein